MLELGTTVRVTSGPHKRSGNMVVEGVEGDRVQVHCPKLDAHFTFPIKLLKVIRGADILESPIPPAAIGNYVPCDPAKLKAGDRIKQAGDPFELKFKTYEPHTETILASFKLPDGDHRTVRVAAGSVLVLREDMPEKVVKSPPEIKKAVESPPEKTVRDDVLYAFAVEPDQGRETLEKYLKDYPQYAAELVDLSHELSRACEDEAPLSDQDLAMVERAWEKHKSAEPKEQAIFDQNGRKLAIGDHITAAWNESLTGTVEQIAENGRCSVLWDGDRELRMDVFATALEILPPEKSKDPPVTDYGHISEPLEIQAPIATFSLEKVAMGEDANADPIRAQIAAIRAEGDVAPDHCWIEKKRHKCGFDEAVFRARSPCLLGKRGGLGKSQYIGKWDSPAHSAATAAVDRRNRIAKLQKQLERRK